MPVRRIKGAQTACCRWVEPEDCGQSRSINDRRTLSLLGQVLSGRIESDPSARERMQVDIGRVERIIEIERIDDIERIDESPPIPEPVPA